MSYAFPMNAGPGPLLSDNAAANAAKSRRTQPAKIEEQLAKIENQLAALEELSRKQTTPELFPSTALWFLILFLFAIVVPVFVGLSLGTNEQLNRFVPLFSVPAAAVAALAIVGISRAVVSRDREVGIASIVVPWILCFLAIMFAVYMAWTFSAPK
jgi:hypothetical protein